MARPKILITNDDGISSPGIMSLWKAASLIGDATVIAPASEQSAMSSSVTLRNPLKVEKMHWPQEGKAWSITGTPADCVKLALSVFLDGPPDIIVSGINRGANAGGEVLYSGTIGGVIVGALRGIPGIAFSCTDYQDTPFQIAEKYIPDIVNHVLEHPLPKGTLLNVNFPANLHNGIKGFKMTRQGFEHWIEKPDLRYHPTEGHKYYWLGSQKLAFEEHEESDVVWLRKGYMTAVPVYVRELTHQDEMEKRKKLFDKVL